MDTCKLYYMCNFIVIIAIVWYISYSAVDTLAVLTELYKLIKFKVYIKYHNNEYYIPLKSKR